MDKSTVSQILNQIIPGNVKEHRIGYQFRCPICGDSKKDPRKQRCWVLFKGDRITVFCHNCGYNRSFRKFLKDYHKDLYDKYYKPNFNNISFENIFQDTRVVEKIKDADKVLDISNDIVPYSFSLLSRNIKDIKLKGLQKKAIEFIKIRKIPKKEYKNFLICYDPNNIYRNRLIIPYMKGKKMYAFQARALNDDYPKYLTHCQENIKLYNFYGANIEKNVYITEGPIDAFFLNNHMATSGSIAVDSEQFKLIANKYDHRIWIFDNDTTGRKRASEFAQAGEKIFIWPKEYLKSNIKDINELVIEKNYDTDQLMSFINANVDQDFSAITKINILTQNKRR